MTDKKAYLIVWEDSVQPGPNWAYIHDLPEPEPLQIVTVGFIVGENDHAIQVAQSLSQGARQCMAVMTIPVGMIRERAVIWEPDEDEE